MREPSASRPGGASAAAPGDSTPDSTGPEPTALLYPAGGLPDLSVSIREIEAASALILHRLADALVQGG